MDGVLIEEFSVTDSFLNSGYFGLVYFHHVSHKPSYENCDPTHLNGVHVLDKEKAGSFKDAQVGDILVSTRNNHTLAILDKETKKVKWLSSGLTLVQHSPYFGKDGRIPIVRQPGGDSRFGGSRIVGIDPTDNTVTTLSPTVATPWTSISTRTTAATLIFIQTKPKPSWRLQGKDALWKLIFYLEMYYGTMSIRMKLTSHF